MWVFSNNARFNNRTTAYVVNIPPALGMDWSYWEANSSPKVSLDQYHDTSHVNDPRYNAGAQTWPDEDQIHHFAAFFAAGASFHALGDKALRHSLKETEDFPKSRNPGDYNLGVVGWDLGAMYESDPTYISATIRKRLTEPALPRPGYVGPTAWGDAGRNPATP